MDDYNFMPSSDKTGDGASLVVRRSINANGFEVVGVFLVHHRSSGLSWMDVS